MFKWLSTLTGGKKTMVFVDYEYWYYSYKTLYGIKPNPASWREGLEKKYDIAEIMVFADFSQTGISEELGKLRSLTNTIIETGNTFMRRKKDMTDFIMLDYIYQCAAERRDIGTYIIFTGDGHFQSVVKYLVQKKQKKVVAYGIKDTFSKHLQAVASETVYLPVEEELMDEYYRMIVSNMAYVNEKQEIIPTFLGTVDAVSNFNNVPKEQIRAALSQMMEKGYIYQRDYRVTFNRKVKIVAADWELLIKDGLWAP